MAEPAAPSIWRTTLGRTLIVWMALCVLLVLGLGPLGQEFPDLWVVNIAGLAFLLPALPLAVWSLVAVARSPRRTWPAPLALVCFCVAFVLGLEFLLLTGARLNMALRQPTYDRIIAEAEAGRLPLDEGGWARGRRYGVTYSVHPGDDRARFDWGTEPGGYIGLLYDEWECYGRNPPTPPPLPPRTEVVEGDAVDPPTVKNAGRLLALRLPINERACLYHHVW